MSTETQVHDTLVGEILSFSRLAEDDAGMAVAETGMRSLLQRVLESDSDSDDIRVDKHFVEGLIEELDAKLGQQMDEILHHETFKAVEAPWRSVKFLVDRTDFSENIKICLLYTSPSPRD